MTPETRYQRVAREQRERQAAREERRQAEITAARKTARAAQAISRSARQERASLEWLVSDHNHDMDA